LDFAMDDLRRAAEAARIDLVELGISEALTTPKRDGMLFVIKD
jgi:hypothetical protein